MADIRYSLIIPTCFLEDDPRMICNIRAGYRVTMCRCVGLADLQGHLPARKIRAAIYCEMCIRDSNEAERGVEQELHLVGEMGAEFVERGDILSDRFEALADGFWQPSRRAKNLSLIHI